MPFQEAIAKVRDARVLHADETHWRVAKRTAWMWVAVTAAAVIYLIRPQRNAAAAKELIDPRFSGVLVSDQFTSYHWFRDERRQYCWAHLLRHFRELLEYGDQAKALGERLLGATERMFEAWHKSRRRAISWKQFLAEVEPIRMEIGALLREGKLATNRQTRAMCKGLVAREMSLWTFTRRSGVEPTNNVAERALRHAVMWRKTSFGNDSERGVRFAERMLSIVATLRRQQRSVLAFIAAACRSALSNSPSPRLFLPTGA